MSTTRKPYYVVKMPPSMNMHVRAVSFDDGRNIHTLAEIRGVELQIVEVIAQAATVALNKAVGK